MSLVGIGFSKTDNVPGDGHSLPIPLFNLVPHPGQAGLLGFFAPFLNSPIYIVVSARTESDYGLNLTSAGITHILPVSYLDLTLWGVPADPSNDKYRLGPIGCASQGTTPGQPDCVGGVASNSPLKPFLSNPTTCGVPLATSVVVTAYDHGTDSASAPYPATTGCDQLSFNPSLFGQPTTTETDSASGIEIDLTVPQGGSPSVPSPSEIRGITLTLPEGFSINPNAADGKSSCSDAAAHFEDRDRGAECAEFSKVGTLTVTSSSLPGPLPGYVYLGDPKPGDRYRLLLAADGFGIHVKLTGSVIPDQQTGRLTASFQNLPQFPFSDFNMHLFGSERGLLATPTKCGTYSVDSTFTPWDSALPEQSSKQFFTLNSGPNGMLCPDATRPFHPRFLAGVADKTAGIHAPLSLELARDDGDQNLAAIDVSTPPGLSATLKGIPYCPESAIAQLAGSTYSGFSEQASSVCPTASQVGTATAAGGAGSRPVYVSGRVYLAGPYKGAPLSFVVVVPAVSGPYDLGNIAVRAALEVDQTSARVTAISDPLPQILAGIPLRTRAIQVNLDRPGFTLNPTDCDPFAVTATISGTEGAVADRDHRFQVGNCADLPYRPRLRLRLSGGLARLGHPAIHAVFSASSGEANTRTVSVALPKGELLDNAHIGNICTRVQFAADACPAASVLGNAEAITPLLDEPLKGKVYLRSSSHNLPDLVADLKGQIDLELAGTVDTVNGRSLRSSFEAVPDAPVTKFVLNLAGGSRGLLVNSESLCGAGKKATVKMTGQNGRSIKQKVSLNPFCGKARNKHHERKFHGSERLSR